MVNLRHFCDQLSKDLNIQEDPIKEEAPGVFVLPIQDDLKIKIENLQEGVSLTCTLCECPKINPEPFLTEVMNGNLFGHITRDCVLGLSEDGNQLTLSRNIDYNIDYKGFSELMQDFYNMALFWKEQASNHIINNK